MSHRAHSTADAQARRERRQCVAEWDLAMADEDVCELHIARSSGEVFEVLPAGAAVQSLHLHLVAAALLHRASASEAGRRSIAAASASSVVVAASTRPSWHVSSLRASRELHCYGTAAYLMAVHVVHRIVRIARLAELEEAEALLQVDSQRLVATKLVHHIVRPNVDGQTAHVHASHAEGRSGGGREGEREGERERGRERGRKRGRVESSKGTMTTALLQSRRG